MIDDEIQTLLRRVESLQAQLDRLTAGDTVVEDTLVVQTVTVSSYPTSAARFYAVQAVDPTGTESENSTGSYGTPTGTFFAFNLGAAVPTSGTKTRISRSGGVWAFRY